MSLWIITEQNTLDFWLLGLNKGKVTIDYDSKISSTSSFPFNQSSFTFCYKYYNIIFFTLCQMSGTKTVISTETVNFLLLLPQNVHHERWLKSVYIGEY